MKEYKGYKIKPDGTFGYKTISNSTRGKVPVTLTGSFTNNLAAERAIDLYVNLKGAKYAEQKQVPTKA